MDLIISLLDSTLRLATPLTLAALAGLLSERSGVVDIGLEGKMLAAAFAAAAVASVTGSAWAGLGAGVIVSVMLALIHGFAAITCNGNQMISGMGINILAAGLTPTLATAWFDQGGQTPSLAASARFTPVTWPLTETIGQLPVIGPLYARLLSGQVALVYLTVALLFLLSWLLKRTRFGLRLRAVGENPHAVDTAGIGVARLRYLAALGNGALCGIAGAYLSTAQGSAFLPEMTAGKGFLALAGLIFGRWRVWPACFACLLFGATDAVQARLQGVALPGIGEVPVQMIQALPYIFTVFVLAGFVGRAVPPRAIGEPYVKSR